LTFTSRTVYTADPYDAATFERWNFMNRVVPDEKLESEARTFAERLARGATFAFAAGNKSVRAYLEGGIRKAGTVVVEIALRCSRLPICAQEFRACSSMDRENFGRMSCSTAGRNN
jgi:enoyl-CoA hydratase/carnithine racemase